MPPFCYLIQGGNEVGDIDVGYGPARVLRPEEVATFDAALLALSVNELQRRFDPDAMMRANIYPEIWDRDPAEDDALSYLLEYFEDLRVFVGEARKLSKGIIIYLA